MQRLESALPLALRMLVESPSPAPGRGPAEEAVAPRRAAVPVSARLAAPAAHASLAPAAAEEQTRRYRPSRTRRLHWRAAKS